MKKCHNKNCKRPEFVLGALMGDCKDMQGKEVTCGFNCFNFGLSEIAKLTIYGQNGHTQRSE